MINIESIFWCVAFALVSMLQRFISRKLGYEADVDAETQLQRDEAEADRALRYWDAEFANALTVQADPGEAA